MTAESQAPRLLVVEDEPQMVMILEYLLRGRGFWVDARLNGAAGLQAFQEAEYDLVMLDVTMPRLGGLELCRRIRAGSDVPVIMVTARSQTEQVLAGFEAGADDYVAKPFEPRILMSRVDALLRRGRQHVEGEARFGPLVVDWQAHRVRVDGRQIALPEVEWRLLAALAERPGEVLSWRLLLTRGWHSPDRVGGRDLVKASIYRLRQRLGERGASLVETVRGAGYRLLEE